MVWDKKRIFSKNIYKGLSKSEVFKMHTDGITCPISNCWKVDEFLGMIREAGMTGIFKGSAPSIISEMKLLPLRFDAIMDEQLDPESRDFLYNLTFNEYGIPAYKGRTAGINACYELTKTI